MSIYLDGAVLVGIAVGIVGLILLGPWISIGLAAGVWIVCDFIE